MLEIQLKGAEELRRRLRATPGQLRNSLRVQMEQLTIEMQIGVQAKLEGSVLHHRSGNLVRNITRSVDQDGNMVVGTVGIGRNAWYGKLHEQGWTGIAQRKNLKLPPHPVKRKDGSTALTGSPYTMHIPQRAFLGPTIDAMRDRIRERFKKAIQEALG